MPTAPRPGGVGARRGGRGRRRRRSSASRTGRRSRRTRCSSGAARGRRSSRPRASSTCSTCAARTARTSTGSAPAPRAARAARALRRRARADRARTACSRRSTLDDAARPGRRRGDRRLPALLLPRPDARAGRRRRSCGGGIPDAHVVASHESRRSSASTSARRRRPPTRTSARCSAGYLRALARAVRATRGCRSRSSCARRAASSTLDEAAAHAGAGAPLGPGRGRRRRGARRRGSRGSRTRSRSTWAARRPTSAPIVGGEADALERAARRRPPDPAADGRHPHRRRRRRLDRLARRGRRAARRAARARAPSPGPACYGRGGDAADGHRREPAARPPARRALAGGLELDRDAAERALALGGASTRRTWSRSSTRRCCARCASSRSSAATTRATSRSSRSAAPAPLHACALAEELGIGTVLVPRGGGRALGARARGRATSGATTVALADVVPARRRRRAAARRARRTSATAGQSFELTVPLGGRRSPSASTARTRSATATPTASARRSSSSRVRTADGAPRAPSCDACRAAPRRCTVDGPAIVELDGATCLDPARAGRATGATGSLVRDATRERPAARCSATRSAPSPRRWARCSSARAFSSNIKERRDCSTALFDADGRMVAQAEHIPVHLGAMPESVAAVIARDPGPATSSSSTTRTPAARTCPTSRSSRATRRSASPSRARTTPTSAACEPGEHAGRLARRSARRAS